MDPVTQGALGVAWAQPAASRSRILPATVVGCVAGMVPDLDLFIRSASDPLLAIEYHRHFTHALIFIPVGALLAALALFPLVRRQLSFRACYGFSLLGYASHGLLDACTSYGTQLFWPFSNARIAWDLVSVIDPFVTFPLIAAIVLAARYRRIAYAGFGLAWCVAYFGFAWMQSNRVETAVAGLAASRGHEPVTIRRLPSFGNLLLWRTIYEADGRYYVDAVRSIFRPVVFDGESVRRLDPSIDLPWLSWDSQQGRDVERFVWFADGYVAIDSANPNRIVDLRFALVPNSIASFWGIELDPDADADTHAAYVTMRNRSVAEGAEFLGMLLR